MREILFRGKRADNGEWIYGSLLVDYPCCKNGVDETVKLYSILDFKTNEEEVKKVEVIPETVGQYIGLTDKNGKKIFEGDIVIDEQSGYEYIIKWFQEYACYALADKRGNMVFDAYEIDMFLNDLIVVGNIHDNSEYMEVSK